MTSSIWLERAVSACWSTFKGAAMSIRHELMHGFQKNSASVVSLTVCMKQRTITMKQLKDSEELFHGFMSMTCQKVVQIFILLSIVLHLYFTVLHCFIFDMAFLTASRHSHMIHPFWCYIETFVTVKYAVKYFIICKKSPSGYK